MITFQKHHYRELNAVAQEKLGPSSESYVTYWLERFPLLLCHTWSSMQFLRLEPAFSGYYDPVFTFPCHKSTRLPDWFYEKADKPKDKQDKDKPRTPQQRRWKTKGVKREEDDSSAPSPTDKEAWIKAGQINGAWRPGRARDRRAEKSSEMDNFVWKIS